MKKKLSAILLTLCMVLTLLPTAALAEGTPTKFTSYGENICANGTPIKIVAGTTANYTNILYDLDNNGAIGDAEYLKIGSAAPTAAGYDLSDYRICGGAQSGNLDGNSMITIDGGYVGDVYGGNLSDNLRGNVTIVMNGGSVKRLLACGYSNNVGETGKTVSFAIHGGTVRGGEDQSVNLESRNNAATTSLLIDGGTINGQISVKSGGSFVIRGGNITGTFKSGTPAPTNGTNPAYKTALTLKVNGTILNNTAVTALTTNAGYTYGMTDVKTDASGKLYVYLPEGTAVTGATTVYGSCTGSVATIAAGTAADDFERTVPLWTDGLSVNASAAFGGGSGTAADPYLLSSTEHLAQLALNVNNGTTYSGKYFKLTTNIDLADKYWVPIGNGHLDRSFKGTLDGDHHIISNMTLDDATFSFNGYARYGFISWMSGATVINLGLENASVSVGSSGQDANEAALLAAHMDASSTIDNCYATGTVTATRPVESIGGLVGHSYSGGTLSNCYFNGTINAAGGTYVGGVIGRIREGGATPANCYTAASITSTATNKYAVASSATNCYYDSTLNSTITGGQGTGKTTTEMRTLATATLLNDGGTAWGYAADINNGYPHLTSFQPPTYTYNTPASITQNGVTAAVTYNKASPQMAGTEITATVTLTGTATAAGTHTVGLTSAEDVGTIIAPLTKTKVVTAGQAMAATDTFEFTFTMPAADVDDLTLTHIFATKQAIPAVTFTATGADTGTLSGVANGLKYRIDSGAWTSITSTADVSLSGLSPCTISVVRPGDGTTTLDSDTQTISVTKAATPSASKADCTTLANNDGKLTGVTAAMEYDDNTGFTSPAGCGGTTVTGLANGTYYVRNKATGTVLASDSQTLTIGAYTPPSTGGGGGSAPSSTYTVPVKSGAGSVNASAAVSNGTATVKVDAGKLDAMLADADTSGSVSIDAGLGKHIDTAAIPTSVIEKLAEAANDSGKAISGLEVALDTGTVSLDAKALAAAADKAAGNTISIHTEEIAKTGLATAQQAALTGEHADDLIVEVTIQSGGVVISNYNGGQISVTLPYTLKAGETAEGVCVWHLAADGSLALMECTYDEATKTVRFVTDHLSDFLVGYDAAASVRRFSDVKESDYFYHAVRWAVAEKITQGTGDTTFSPTAPCTRGQMAAFLWHAAGSPEPAATVNPFTDVKTDAHYYKAVLWAVERGVTLGANADGTAFNPNGVCTRGQMATFLYRYAGSPAVTAANPFTDVAASDYCHSAVIWAAAQGITLGVNADGTVFRPKANCTRAQIVTFLYRHIVK